MLRCARIWKIASMLKLSFRRNCPNYERNNGQRPNNASELCLIPHSTNLFRALLTLWYAARDLWKEGSKLEQQYRHADEQLKAAERTISSTMDRVSFDCGPI